MMKPREYPEEKKKQLREMNDWYAFCPRCKKRITGTVAQLSAHLSEACDGE